MVLPPAGKDFDKGIADAAVRFEISEHRCNFSSKAELITAIQRLKTQSYDVIALVLGGGDKASMEIFNDPEPGDTIHWNKTNCCHCTWPYCG